jgi:hypothetical protein
VRPIDLIVRFRRIKRKAVNARGAATIALCLLISSGCRDDNVGEPCELRPPSCAASDQSESAQSAPAYRYPAPECTSGLCLAMGDRSDSLVRPLCTKLCDSDSDCPASADTCPKGERFVCVFTVQTTALACCKMCVCRYFIGKDMEATATACQKITCPYR